MAILTKLPTAETRAGLHGFNQVLVMIALTSFIPLTPQAFLIALFATISCSLCNACPTANFRDVGFTCINRGICVYNMDILTWNLGLYEYSSWDRMVKTISSYSKQHYFLKWSLMTLKNS